MILRYGKSLILLCALSLLALNSCAVQRSKVYKNALTENVPYPTVRFLFDRDVLQQSDLRLLEKNAEWMNRNKDVVIILEGHCDEVGPNKYNMELGDRRAREVKSLLIKNGVDHNRIIMVVSYGESRPVDVAHNRDAWRKNRRVEFIVR